MAEQLTWIHETREERLEKEISKLREQCENVRKGQFAKIAKLNKITEELEQELNFLKSAICKEAKYSIF